MRILSINNSQSKQNNSFGMIKIVDAKTADEVQQAVHMVQTIKGGGCKPFTVADAMDPSKKISCFRFENLLDSQRVLFYKQNGQNVLILDEEINTVKKIWAKPTAFIENFEKHFNNPIETTFSELRAKYLEFKGQFIDKLRMERALQKINKNLSNLKDELIKK